MRSWCHLLQTLAELYNAMLPVVSFPIFCWSEKATMIIGGLLVKKREQKPLEQEQKMTSFFILSSFFNLRGYFLIIFAFPKVSSPCV